MRGKLSSCLWAFQKVNGPYVMGATGSNMAWKFSGSFLILFIFLNVFLLACWWLIKLWQGFLCKLSSVCTQYKCGLNFYMYLGFGT